MPEMRFTVRWPDGTVEGCYSPSLVIKDYFTPGESYPLADFLGKSREALTIASQRVEARYGFPCSRAMGQLARIEAAARNFSSLSNARVAVEAFDE
ncbi:MSMEG_0570 family nitrogen starvation response protein [Ancylobacter sp. TS-1]|uniref:MSMEG_0570 family nitrogen starvation response protein n=1 Tax=Ancylobacter sp. TS-1 TaxID=1850374 RepID=UPI001265D048|nr:MSMEG_0570 family nitrogen starvation response protein [Ancylobacter sp. TS-1]QFR33821.1 MSMEG_0570 family nitrogen starvation response protein [Ancylobacter sp. TS-1]